MHYENGSSSLLLVRLLARLPGVRVLFYRWFLCDLDWPLKRWADAARAEFLREILLAVGEGSRISDHVKITGGECVWLRAICGDGYEDLAD